MNSSELDIRKNRSRKEYLLKEYVARILWSFSYYFLFRLSPRTFFSFRRFLLRVFGAKVGANVNIYGSAVIYFPWNLEVGDWSAIGEHAYIYNLGPVKIGRKTTISHRAHICAGTHDYAKTDLPLLKPEIIIGDQVWVCTDAFVGPGVTIGEGSIVGARAVVTKDVNPWDIVAGNPAKFIKKREFTE